ncbi:hypothetical protein [Bosea vaviloviae]|uniref:Uncharacterized protein n=1 Tax=Bosea vaviloviae TaxID=1526658 RepID=A0A1D7TVR0_9HYPH|nr:hypothetical protein [Bosea vaviloviae]AOO79200.1 hypothetical protein BHK69_00645 [Bosea vaviloviae]
MTRDDDQGGFDDAQPQPQDPGDDPMVAEAMELVKLFRALPPIKRKLVTDFARVLAEEAGR